MKESLNVGQDRPIAPFPELPQDRPNLSNCDEVICGRMTLYPTRPALAAQVAQWSLHKRGQMACVVMLRTSGRT
jgi:hypothetical protein